MRPKKPNNFPSHPRQQLELYAAASIHMSISITAASGSADGGTTGSSTGHHVTAPGAPGGAPHCYAFRSWDLRLFAGASSPQVSASQLRDLPTASSGGALHSCAVQS